MNPPELWRWDAAALANAIRAKTISSREAVEAVLARLAEINPKLNAVTVDLSQDALAAADRADAAVARTKNGAGLGLLHGVPVTVKENVDQAGCATTNGVVAYRDAIASEDSPPVANWKKAGAVIIGRTNTPAFSFRLDTVNALRGRTFSPWSRSHTPGGSSGGAASAVASGIGPLAHGNDIAGSVRYPAFCNGLAGIRPSFGRVPAWNPSQPAERVIAAQIMSVQGVLARSVRDVRLGLAAMAAHDARDPWWVPAPLEGPPVPRPIRVAVVRDAADLRGAAPSPAIAAALDTAVRALADAGYAVVDERTPGFTAAAEHWLDMFVPQFVESMQPDFERYGDGGLRTAMRYLMAMGANHGHGASLKALANRSRLVRDWNLFLERVPLVLAPTCTEPPYSQGFDVESETRTAEIWRQCVTLMAVPALGLPAMAVATGVADGLPVGVQLIGPRFREDLVLAAAEAIEARTMAREPRTPIDPRW
jgi:amidase